MRELLPILTSSLAAGRPLVLAMVVGRRGSLPMAQCAKMAILADGTTHGTVGGGCLEAEVWAVGRRLLEEGGCSLDTFHLNEVEEGLGGHVCGGTVSILSRVLRPEDSTRRLVEKLRESIESERPVGVVTALPAADGRAPDQGWALVAAEGTPCADGLDLAAATLARCQEALGGGAPARLENGLPPTLFVEPLPPEPVAAIFGAGHCGRAIGQAAAAAGFRVRLMDDRAPFVEPQRAPWAESSRVVDFARVGESLEVLPHHYLVIVTRGHEHDLTLLRQLITGPAAYLGMIGSARKRLLFERTLRGEGIAEGHLARLRSPMGLPIGADTPEEIAVAVVGEMIAVRRGVGGAAREST